MEKIISGEDLKLIGFQEGKVIGKILEKLTIHSELSTVEIMPLLIKLKQYPENFLDDVIWQDVATMMVDKTITLRKNADEYTTYGTEYIEAGAIVIISDVHGRTSWKEIIAQNKHVNKFIFLGDYFDSFDIAANEQILNFQELIKFKEENSHKVILLTGNHDLHYLPYFLNAGEYYSGFQGARSHEISHLIQANLPHLQIAYQHNDILFTHAGVTNTWLKNNGFDKNENVVEFMNQLFMYQPKAFRFVGFDPYGDSKESSPVWARPRSLMSNAYQFDKLKQVVGHTEYKNIIIVKERYYFTDAPDSGEYLYIEDDLISVKNIFNE